jgi:hypothetical protein
VNIDVNSRNSVTQYYSAYPTQTQLCFTAAYPSFDDDEVTVVVSNCTTSVPHHQANALTIAPTHAIADTGATSIFIMAGAPANNICVACNPINISLPDGKRITSTHTCDIIIPGLPQTLVRHIIPEMKMASLLRIRILCKAGCEVIFDNEKCWVTFNGKTIMTGSKDPTSNLWTLP